MKVFDYECPSCNRKFEAYVADNNDTVKCQACGAECEKQLGGRPMFSKGDKPRKRSSRDSHARVDDTHVVCLGDSEDGERHTHVAVRVYDEPIIDRPKAKA